jgi:antitoxin ParD1/3/4
MIVGISRILDRRMREIARIVAMNLTLKPEQEQFIQDQMSRGRFHSADEVLAKAFALLEEKYQDYELWVEDVRLKVDEAKEEADRGEVLPLETVMNQFQQKFDQARENQR